MCSYFQRMSPYELAAAYVPEKSSDGKTPRTLPKVSGSIPTAATASDNNSDLRIFDSW